MLEKEMNNTTALGLATSTIILNGIIGHFFAPNGIWNFIDQVYQTKTRKTDQQTNRCRAIYWTNCFAFTVVRQLRTWTILLV
jgi:Na+/glutamate symporter